MRKNRGNASFRDKQKGEDLIQACRNQCLSGEEEMSGRRTSKDIRRGGGREPTGVEGNLGQRQILDVKIRQHISRNLSTNKGRGRVY